MPRVMVDPEDQTVSYTGDTMNGPELARATTVAGIYSQIDGSSQAGISISNGKGTGWISELDGQYIRTARDGNPD